MPARSTALLAFGLILATPGTGAPDDVRAAATIEGTVRVAVGHRRPASRRIRTRWSVHRRPEVRPAHRGDHEKWLFYAEAYWSEWEAPLIDDDLVSTGAYVEGRYDFLPEWFAALRVDGMTFSDIGVARHRFRGTLKVVGRLVCARRQLGDEPGRLAVDRAAQRTEIRLLEVE